MTQHDDDLADDIAGEYRHKQSPADGLRVERDGAAYTFIFSQMGEDTSRCTKTEAAARLALKDYRAI